MSTKMIDYVHLLIHKELRDNVAVLAQRTKKIKKGKYFFDIFHNAAKSSRTETRFFRAVIVSCSFTLSLRKHSRA